MYIDILILELHMFTLGKRNAFSVTCVTELVKGNAEQRMKWGVESSLSYLVGVHVTYIACHVKKIIALSVENAIGDVCNLKYSATCVLGTQLASAINALGRAMQNYQICMNSIMIRTL